MNIFNFWIHKSILEKTQKIDYQFQTTLIREKIFEQFKLETFRV